MTHTRLAAVSALIAITGFAACSAAPGSGAPAAGAAPAASPAKAAPPVAVEPAAASPAADALPPPSAPLNTGTFTGTVAETMNSGGYTYMRLRGGKDGKEEIWAAAAELPIKASERVTVPLEMAMEKFHSKTLNRDFPVLYFVSKVARDGEAVEAHGSSAGAVAPIGMMGSHQPAAATAAPVEPIPAPAGGLKIADVWAQRKALAGKPVAVRGKVVKVNNGIMDRNWVHLQDGSGKAADKTNDLTITTDAEVKLGDIVTVSGVLGVEKDFGAGYAYDAILERAKVTGK